ncbi:MAG: hypothetical protein IID39_00250 [Planctomycetes bacterium]|nr:hypothetical protein [Planctomycetota bacterium]
MKTERRHELKTNELGAFVLEVNDWLKGHGTLVGVAVVVVVVVVFGATYARRSQTSAQESAWRTLSQLTFDAIQADSSFQQVDQLIAETKDPDLKMDALMRKGEGAMSLALLQSGGFHPEFLDQAESAYRTLRDEFPERAPVVGLALSGLATIEECRFVVDNDPAHRETAKGYLERLQNDALFKGTPFQTDATQRLLNLEKTFEIIELATSAPDGAVPATPVPIAPAPAPAQTETPTLESSTTETPEPETSQPEPTEPTPAPDPE